MKLDVFATLPQTATKNNQSRNEMCDVINGEQLFYEGPIKM